MTSLSLKALEMQQHISERMFYSSYMVRYDSKKERFVEETNHRRLIPLYFTWILVTCIIWLLSISYIVIYQGVFHPERVTYNRLFFSVVVSAPAFLSNGLNFTIYRNKGLLASYANYLLVLRERFLARQTPKGGKCFKDLLICEWKKFKAKRKDVDIIGLLMVSLVWILAIVPILYIPAPFIIRADPFSYLVHEATGYDEFPIWMQIPFRFVPAVGTIICIMECVRVLGFIFVGLIILGKITADLLQRVEKISETDLSMAVEQYALLHAIHWKGILPAGDTLLVAMLGGMFIAVMSISGTMVGWGILDPFLYFLNPIMAFFSLIIIDIGFSCATYSAELSLKLFSLWKFRIYKFKRGYKQLNLRRVNSFQPLAFFIGLKGFAFKDTRREMFDAITRNSVETILMVENIININS